jgi:hypothetical protein
VMNGKPFKLFRLKNFRVAGSCATFSLFLRDILRTSRRHGCAHSDLPDSLDTSLEI